jgi:hypothetical protein
MRQLCLNQWSYRRRSEYSAALFGAFKVALVAPLIEGFIKVKLITIVIGEALGLGEVRLGSGVLQRRWITAAVAHF